MADEKNALLEAFKAAVKAQINDDRQHGWGADDSLAVIEGVIAEDASIEIAALVAAGKKPEAYGPSELALKLIRKVINPSQYRQELENQKMPDGRTVLAKSAKAKVEKEAFSIY